VDVNGAKFKDRTDTRMTLPSGQYTLEIRRDGYHTWKRVTTVEGGSVERFDYPLLFPTTLLSSSTKQYAAPVGLMTQSPDHRWLLTGEAGQNTFDLFDINAKQPVAKSEIVPADILAAGSTTKSWEVTEWSTDNRHVVLKRSYERPGQSAVEYVLFDRQDPSLSQNLSVLFGFSPTNLELKGGTYDQYYLYDQTSAQLFTASLKKPTPLPFLSDVLAFTSERDLVLYVTTKDAPVGKVLVRMQKNSETPATIRQLPTNTEYLLDLATFDDAPHVAIGAQSEIRVHVYRDPMHTLRNDPTAALVPLQVLKVASPTYLSFSANKRFVVAEGADRFAVYDAEADRGYSYQTGQTLDAPQAHATWMDGFRLTYVSAGEQLVFDYDGTNLQHVTLSSPVLQSVFDRNYRVMYSLTPSNALQSTSLLTKEDQ
jgi:hypothetical protein